MSVPLPDANVVDRLVGFFSPAAAVKRLRARAGLMILSGGSGGYDAGRSDSKSMQRYNPRNHSAATAILPGLDRMRARSRDQVRNNPLAAGAVNTAVTSTVGSGMTCQPNIDQELLGLTDEEADAWESEALRWWNLWAESTECDIEGELVFGELQNLAYRSVLESGDILRLRRFLWDADASSPMRGETFATKLQFVEADRVSNPDFALDTTRLQGGVEVDGDGRVTRYWVQTTHPGDTFVFRSLRDWSSIPARHPRTRPFGNFLMVTPDEIAAAVKLHRDRGLSELATAAAIEGIARAKFLRRVQTELEGLEP